MLGSRQCCVKGCKSNSRKKDPEISFHRLPKNLKTRAKWIENIGRRDWNPTPNTYICSLHFEKNCVNRTLNVPRVKDNCFPTIFPHVIAPDESNSQASTSKDYSLQLQRKELSSTTHYIQWDQTYASSSTEQVSTVIIQKMTNKIKTQQKKIKRLNEKVRRQSNKIFNLQSVLTNIEK
ncbi:THAP domain-containing protein 1-like [Manduca sexta]|uniref:THAP domain-containing protein 1-like n=1 Tax=Manduca sexta TaxID=7130 RepID=UPI001890B31B|nr:THAP domain-containing protein 1-like [Manduca sexta]